MLITLIFAAKSYVRSEGAFSDIETPGIYPRTEFKLKQTDIYKTYCDLVEYLVLVEYPNLFYFFKFYFIFKLYITVLVLPNIKMNPPQVYMCSSS